MHKKHFLLLLPLIFLLVACSGTNSTAAANSGAANPGANTASGQGQNQPNQPPDMSNQPIEMKLAVGTLTLEGTDRAVTTEQAKTLLPLWKAVKALSSDSNAAAQELSAVYAQIQEAMTAEQVQAIEDMSLSMEDTQALMDKYGIKMPQNPAGQLNEAERATRVAERQAQGGGQSGAGGFPGGVPPAGGAPGGRMPGDGAPGLQNVQGTPQPGQGGRVMRGGGYNLMFVDALIQMLTERAGA